jgi:hypothetical protein
LYVTQPQCDAARYQLHSDSDVCLSHAQTFSAKATHNLLQRNSPWAQLQTLAAVKPPLLVSIDQRTMLPLH